MESFLEWAGPHWYYYFAPPAIYFFIDLLVRLWGWWNWDKFMFDDDGQGDGQIGVYFAGFALWPVCIVAIAAFWVYETLDNYRRERLKRLGRKK